MGNNAPDVLTHEERRKDLQGRETFEQMWPYVLRQFGSASIVCPECGLEFTLAEGHKHEEQS